MTQELKESPRTTLKQRLGREDELALIRLQRRLQEEGINDGTPLIQDQAQHLKRGRRERLRAEERAGKDSLTGLCNRGEFTDRLIAGAALAKRRGHNLALLILDLDNLKTINDINGHQAGDHVLIALTDVLKDIFRETDTIARIGGDEFAVILEAMSKRGAKRTIERLREAINERTITVSGGIAYLEGTDDTVDDLFARADEAMYRAKFGGKNSVVFTKGKGPDKKFIKLY